MTAADIADARRIEAFRAWLEAACAKRGLSLNALGRRVAMAAGGTASSQVYNVANGKTPLTADFAERIAVALEIGAADVLEAYHYAPSADAAVPVRRSPPVQRPAEQFMFSVDSNGRATVRLNLTDLDVERAMRVMAALTGAGLLPTTPQEA